MKRNLQIILALFIAINSTSCVKENLYVVETEDNGGNSGQGDDPSDDNNDNNDNNNDDNDEVIVDKISSLIIVSDDYTTGMPAIYANGRYRYTPINNIGTTSTFISGIGSAISEIKVKVNPSSASLDSIDWKIVRRTAATKVMASEEIFNGDIVVTRSQTTPELVSLNIKNITDDFFDVDGGYVYSVIATQNDGAQVSSDVACLKGGTVVDISDIFIGNEIDGKVFSYSDDYILTSDSLVVDKPKLYGLLPSGDVMSFDEMGIDKDQYSLDVAGFNTQNSENLLIDILECDNDKNPILSSTQWMVYINDRYKDCQYNEVNGYCNIKFELYDSKGVLVAPYYSNFYTYMDDVNLESKASVSSNFTSLTFGVFSKALGDELLMERLTDTTSGGQNTFVDCYCNAALGAKPIQYYIDDVISTDMSLDYTTNIDNIQLTVNKQLPAGIYKVKVVLSSKVYATVLTETITLTVE